MNSFVANIPSVLCSGMATLLIILDKPYWWVFVILSLLQITSVKIVRKHKDGE